MLSVLTALSVEKQRDKEKTPQGAGYVYCLDCDDDVTGVCICPDSSNCIY